jgi:hypothetical protein
LCFNQRANAALAICAAGQDVSKDLENMNRRIEQMAREMQMGFQHTDQRLTVVSEKVSSLADSVTTVTALVHTNTLALLDQREERMKKDLLGQLELSIVHMDMEIMRTSDASRQAELRRKLDHLEEQRDRVRDECESMTSTITTLMQNPPQAASSPLKAPTTPPGLTRNMLPPPPPPPTPIQNGVCQLPPTPSATPLKRAVPPHMDDQSTVEPNIPKKKPRKSNPPLSRARTMSLRSTTSSSQLQVTSQQELADEEMDDGGDVFMSKNTSNTVSATCRPESALTNLSTHTDPAEQTMMQASQTTVRVSRVDNFNISAAERNACGVRLGRKVTSKSSSKLVPFIFLMVCLFSFI